jgi:hypothetical protein
MLCTPECMVVKIQNSDSNSWIISPRNIVVPPYQTWWKWTETPKSMPKSTERKKKISKKSCASIENHEFWSPGSTFQWCFYGGSYIGIFLRFANWTRPSGRRGNFYQDPQRQHLLSCALSTAERLSCPKSIGSIGGTKIFLVNNIQVVQKQVVPGCTAAGRIP